MGRLIRYLALAALMTGSAAAASPEADVLTTVAAALQAVNTNDPAALEAVMLPEAIIVAQRYDKATGRLVSHRFSVAEMAERLRTPGGAIDERIQDPAVLVQRDLAHVWSRYTLDRDGQRLHCGVDSFGLAKLDGAWRLTSWTWTAEPKGCPQ